MPNIRCPGCKARYKVPHTAGGKRTKCKKCGQTFKIPQLAPPKPPPPTPTDGTIEPDDLLGLAGGQAIDAPGSQRPADSGGQPAMAIPVSSAVGYAPDAGATDKARGHGSYGAYFKSLGQSAAFPKRGGDLATFLIVWVLLCLGAFLGGVGFCLAGVGSLIITAWYLSFQLNVVLGAAAGDEELPSLTLTGGWWDDIIVPSVKMICVTIVAWLPAIAYMFTVGAIQAMGGMSGVAGGRAGGAMQVLSTQDMLMGGLLLAAGYFVWPMLILVVAVGGIGELFRVDLMLRTIIKSFPAYLLVAVLSLAAIGVTLVVGYMAEVAGGDESGLGKALGLAAALLIAELYCKIITMRAIGFYYHHFKHKFAWTWG